MANLHVTDTTIADRAVVSIEGVVDLSSLATLQNALARAIQRRPGGVVTADLDGVTTIDDCALGILLGAAATARRSGGDLELVVGDGPLRARIEQTRLDRAIDVRSTIA